MILRAHIAILLTTAVLSSSAQPKIPISRLQQQIDSVLQKQQGDFAVAFKDLSTGQELLIHEHERFHAASTMKTAVLIELYKQAAAGRFSLSDSLTIKNEFRSIADSSIFHLDPADDSEYDLYKHTGEKRSISQLIYLMITVSSNLATNLLIEKVEAKQVMQTLHELGANEMQVLRGVEDNKAYEKGLNNTVTAYGLMLIFEKMAEGKIVNAEASDAMIKILLDQHFNEIIPARLPAGVKVAHKTGWFKSVNHDSGIVFLPDGRKYVLVLLSKNIEHDEEAVKTLAGISGMIYHYLN